VFIGGVTAVGGTLIAIAQIDIKRTLSYLASAYMGLAFIAVGVGQTQTALFLVFTYAVSMALLVMSVGGVIWNSISQDLTQYGGLWSKRPASGLSFLVGAAGFMALPPFGSFWALAQLANQVSETKPWLLGLLLVVNGLTAFGLTRVFSLIFGNKLQPMTERSPEIAWPMALPMLILMGFVLHVPLLLWQWQILPWTILTTTVTVLLIASTVVGVGLGGLIYLNQAWKKPVKLPWQPLQDLLAYDFYTAKIYRFTIVLVVGLVSKIMYWFDRYIVDGFVNLVGMATVFSGQSLKYNTSGQTQFYALTILLGIGLLGIWVSWPILSRLSLIVG
jgi:NAD(P)H-quinone oxidoreductase subunit 5